MSPEQTTRTPAGTAPAGTAHHDHHATPSRIAARITYHHSPPGETPEERYYAATGRWPCDD